jgi:AP-3 complex subunit delta-1
VALLAFNKIVVTHPHLVAQQEDVILECIDSPDITIRIQALDLVQGMVTGDNLISVVSRLMKQLKTSTPTKERTRSGTPSLGPSSDSEDESQIAITEPAQTENQAPPLPEDYRLDVIGRILFMCSKDNYSNIVDFDWYIDVLTQLVRMAPVPRQFDSEGSALSRSSTDISLKIGDELRNVAVKVRALRSTAVRAGFTILAQLNADTPSGHKVTSGALNSVTWLLGEYAILLQDPDGTMNSLLQLVPRAARHEVCTTALLAIAKIFASIAGDETEPWTAERKSRISLLMARILHVTEPLVLHPNLEVQERAVEFVELLKLTAEAASGQPASTEDAPQDPPLLLTQAIPSLFKGSELNSVAQGAQRNVPTPDGLDLDEPIHSNLTHLLSTADLVTLEADESDDFEVYYNQRPAPVAISSSGPAISRLADPVDEAVGSYQQPSEESYLDADIIARRKAERLERNKDDPFYIPSNDTPRTSTPIHNILQNSNGPDLDIDSIPIMKLDLDSVAGAAAAPAARPQPRRRQKIVIASDETLEGSDGGNSRQHDSDHNSDSLTKAKIKKLKHSLLQVDSSHIGSFSLEGSKPANGFDYEQQQREEAEMQQAIKEVERLRLEMQRANERIQVAHGVDAEGTIIRKKKKKVVKKTPEEEVDANGLVKPKKKKKKVKPEQDQVQEPGAAAGDTAQPTLADTPAGSTMPDDVVLPRKKKTVKKKKMAEIEDLG